MRRAPWTLPLLTLELAWVLAACSGAAGTDGDTSSTQTEASSTDADAETSSEDASSSTSDGSDGSASTTGDEFWQPVPGTTWHWQLTGTVSDDLGELGSVEMVDLDLFEVPVATIDALRSQGAVVICYFSAGSHEDWRPDADDFPSAAIGDPLDGWPGERWIDFRDTGVRAVMSARLDLAVEKHCDGVEPDNVDGYTNGTGFTLLAEEQLDYNRFLASEAHQRGLSIGLKNDLEQVGELLADFDWALNEECQSYDECGALSPFIDAGKAVFHVEYVDEASMGDAAATTVCPDALARDFSTLVKTWDLDAWGIACE